MSQDPIEYFSFDGDEDEAIAPHRPTLGNLGGGEWLNDVDPPDPETFLDANTENQNELVLYGLAQTAFALLLQVEFSSGTPGVTGFSTIGTRLTIADITVVDNGNGNTVVSWPAGYLVPGSIGPILTLIEDVEIDRARAIPAVDKLSVTVKTKLGATGTDCGFTLVVHGG